MRAFESFAEEKNSAGLGITCSVFLASLFLRLFYLNFTCLLPEEAYYWQYARHLDIAYLDHPPMVALTIFLGTKVFGINEFGVRIGAVVWWMLSGVFVYLLSSEVFGRKTAHASLIVFSTLPYFFWTGFFETPDSPLLAFWAAALYFLYKTLITQSEKSWWGVGLCFGLGMLSKYSISILGLATLVYMIIDAKSRHHFLSFRPYVAAFAALMIFSPVLLWNFEHQWVSFAFQSSDRLSKPMEFSLHVLVLHVLAVLSPLGLWIFGKGCLALWHKESRFFFAAQREKNLFIWIFTLLPLLVFALFSLIHDVKINWTGPVFLAFIPYLGRSLELAVVQNHRSIERGWQWTIAILLIVYALFLQYVSFFLPGLPYLPNMYKFLTGSNIASQVLQLERQIERVRGQRPIVVGMDKHYLASQFGFYRERAKEENEILEETAGRNLFKRESLMYRFWTKPESLEGRNMILISRSPDDLSKDLLRPYFQSLGNMQDLQNQKGSYVVGRFYYRVGSGYREKRGK